ncbi:MAG: GTP 3',8-cyclase MoaA [Candidatus Hodarchaeales archaeon]|jgi:cyclic pyranopterin phosphate synthase
MADNTDNKSKTFVPIQLQKPLNFPLRLTDSYNRQATSLRISVTDKCNLRCRYCMPEEGVKFTSHDELLSFEEITEIVKIFHKLGINQIRITGGEPLVRREVTKLFNLINKEVPDIKLCMTTNGILLKKFLPELLKAGLEKVNISLDTLNSKKFTEITRRNQFQQTIEGINAALKSSLKVKINVVALRNFNDSEIIDFVKFALKQNTTVRFIEWMPFTGNDWYASYVKERDPTKNPEFISAKELRKVIINAGYDLTPITIKNISKTSRDYKINESKARIGFIASVTESFCEYCNRIRLTADGKLRPCLHSSLETDLKLPMRSGITNKDLITLITQTYFKKPKEHENFLSSDYEAPVHDREMNRIGG